MESYLLTATRFAIIDYIRQKVARKKFLEYYHAFLKIQSVSQHTLDSHELPELIEEGLSPLSETTKDIFRLSYFQNWKKETIARHFHLSEKAIEYHLTKSQKTIR